MLLVSPFNLRARFLRLVHADGKAVFSHVYYSVGGERVGWLGIAGASFVRL